MKPKLIHASFLLFFAFFTYNASAQTAEDRIAMGLYLKPSYHEYQLIHGVNQIDCLYNPDSWNDNPYNLEQISALNLKNEAVLKDFSDKMSCEQIINSFKNYFSGRNPDEAYK